jgi:hypothetical protein
MVSRKSLRALGRIGVDMKVVNSRKRPLNRNTVTYRRAVRCVAFHLFHRWSDDADIPPLQIARRHFPGADEVFVRAAIEIGLPDADRSIKYKRQEIAKLERYIAELSAYAATDPARSPALRLAVNNSTRRSPA